MNINLRNQKNLDDRTTGGGDFIGSNLYKTLIDKNNKINCSYNFTTAKRENIRWNVD
jgi:hypothetical protein